MRQNSSLKVLRQKKLFLSLTNTCESVGTQHVARVTVTCVAASGVNANLVTPVGVDCALIDIYTTQNGKRRKFKLQVMRQEMKLSPLQLWPSESKVYPVLQLQE